MDNWPRARNSTSSSSSSRRLFGMDWSMLLTTAVVLFCLAIAFLAHRPRSGPARMDEYRAGVKVGPAALPSSSRRNDSSLSFRPVWGMPRPDENAQAADPAQSSPLRDEGPIEREMPSFQLPGMPDPSALTQQISEAATKMIPSKSAAGENKGANSYGAGSSAPAPAAPARPGAGDSLGGAAESAEQAEAAPVSYASNISHAHAGGPQHTHDSKGLASMDGKKHRHPVREKDSVSRAPSSSEIAGGFNTQKVNMLRLEQIGRELHDESLRTGKPIEISDDQAREIADEIGLTGGGKDKAPSRSRIR